MAQLYGTWPEDIVWANPPGSELYSAAYSQQNEGYSYPSGEYRGIVIANRFVDAAVSGLAFYVRNGADSPLVIASRESSNPPALRVTYEDVPPDAPTPTDPIGDYKDNAQVIRFGWTYNSSVGGTQKAFDLQWSTDQSTWTTVNQTTANNFYDMPADTMPAGNIYWRVRCYNEYDEVGPYSAAASFYAVGAPTAPVINAVPIDSARPIVSWSAFNQQIYQLQVLQGDTVIYDSGNIPGIYIRQHKITAFLPDGSYTVKLRIKNEYDMWSAWGETAVTIATIKPAKPTLTLTKTAYGFEAWTQASDADYNLLYRDNICIAKAAPGDILRDNSCVSGREYQYILRAVKDDAYMDSSPVLAAVELKYSLIAPISDLSNVFAFTRALNAPPKRSFNRTLGGTSVYYAGRKNPVWEPDEHVSFGLSLSFFLRTWAEVEKFIAIYDLNQTVIYRDAKGRKIYGTLSNLAVEEIRQGYTVSFVISQTDTNEIMIDGQQIANVEIFRPKKYTVQFTGDSLTGTRTDDAVGMVANVAVDDELVRNDFDNVPFYNRPLCNVYFDAEGYPHVMAYRGEPGFNFEGAIFPPFTEVAEVYYECLPCGWNGSFDAPSVVGWPCEGYELFECFPDWDTPIYLPSYWMAVVDGKPTSRSGTMPGYYSLNSAMSTAKAWNANAHAETMAAHMYEYILQAIEFATRDPQTIMMGACALRYNSPDDKAVIAEAGTNRIVLPTASANTYVPGQTIVIGTAQNSSNVASERSITAIETYDADNKALMFDGAPVNIAIGNFVSSRLWKNGATDIVRASSGSPASNTSGKYPCIWRGKVDPWSNGFSAIADILIQRRGTGTTEDPYTYRPYYLPDPRKYANGIITDDYVELEYDMSPADGWAKTLGQDSRYRLIGLTSEVGGSSTTYFSAYYYYPHSAICVVFAGGSFGDGVAASPVCFSCGYSPSGSGITRLARLFVTREQRTGDG
jgi:hypothetical protein